MRQNQKTLVVPVLWMCCNVSSRWNIPLCAARNSAMHSVWVIVGDCAKINCTWETWGLILSAMRHVTDARGVQKFYSTAVEMRSGRSQPRCRRAITLHSTKRLHVTGYIYICMNAHISSLLMHRVLLIRFQQAQQHPATLRVPTTDWTPLSRSVKFTLKVLSGK